MGFAAHAVGIVARTSSDQVRFLMNVTRASVVLLAAALAGHATPIVSSTFDTDADGWIGGAFLTISGPTASPTYFPAEGNPGGFLRLEDFVQWTAYHAPSKFLGNQSTWYGHALTFDLRASGTDGAVYSAVVISDGTTSLQYRGLPWAGLWSHFHIPLLASAGWQYSTDGKSPGAAATESELKTVLSNLQFLHIDADWMTGMDYADLDNVEVIYNPEPSTMLLLGGALAVLAAIGGRRAQKIKNRR
jgi:hypothetical protein